MLLYLTKFTLPKTLYNDYNGRVVNKLSGTVYKMRKGLELNKCHLKFSHLKILNMEYNNPL